MGQKTLYLECYSGISGDMTVGALLDLGADETVLRETLNSLNLEGYEISIERVRKCGIDACSFDVSISEQPFYDEGHGMGTEHILHQDLNENSHHHGGHDHHHEHCHNHSHNHRNLAQVFEILDRIRNDGVKQLSKKIFRIVAEAESKAHNLPIEQVHFHEVGAIDSIIDIVSAAACVVSLGITKVIVSELFEGKGHVCCQHGIMPVPAPATLNIVQANGLKIHLTDNRGEMITPTGAAIAAALRTEEKLPFEYRICKVGAGAGKKEFQTANILRAMIIE